MQVRVLKPATRSGASVGLGPFLHAGLQAMFQGSVAYWVWVVVLVLLIAFGITFYAEQLIDGLVVTHMTNQVSWGFYLANFTFLVGIAAAAVMLVIPAYVFHREDIKEVVVIADAMAIAAVTMAILFVVTDLGRPDRLWHLIPGLGHFHLPESMLAWDVVVLSGYLVLNVGISFYIVYCDYRGCEPNVGRYLPFVLIAILWAFAIHTVTAFLYSANTGRAFWHTALLAPRFIASALCSGPALMIIGLQIIGRLNRYPIPQSVIHHLALVMTVALQITLFLLGAEVFTEFFNEGQHAVSARYLFLGLEGHTALVPWIWSALVMLGIATLIGSVHVLRHNPITLNIACGFTVVGVWVEKGMGLVVPGFVPTPIGEIYEYAPSVHEIAISIGIWGLGLLLFTLLAKAAIAIQFGSLSGPSTHAAFNEPGVRKPL